MNQSNQQKSVIGIKSKFWFNLSKTVKLKQINKKGNKNKLKMRKYKFEFDYEKIEKKSIYFEDMDFSRPSKLLPSFNCNY